MEKGVFMSQTFLRICCLVSALAAACLVRFDSQTKVIMFTVDKTATYRDLKAFRIFVVVETTVACYNLLQLCKSALFARFKGNTNGTELWFSWICFFIDQMVAYMSLATTAAAVQASYIALTGVDPFQWTKLCNRFTRFCYQVGGGLVCALAASLLMAFVASISAFCLFRRYSPKHFFSLKAR